MNKKLLLSGPFAAALFLAHMGGCSLLAAPAFAETQEQLLGQGPPKTSQPLPDPGHIPMVFGKDIPWKGENGERSAALFGDPSKPGIYGVLIKWEPGHNSRPHFHSTDRYIYVVSGTWWVSSSTQNVSDTGRDLCHRHQEHNPLGRCQGRDRAVHPDAGG
jgi:hypothetical protein